MIPLLCDVERMKKGGEHWQWDYSIPMYIGVLPRHGAKGSDVKVCPIYLPPNSTRDKNLTHPPSGSKPPTASPAT